MLGADRMDQKALFNGVKFTVGGVTWVADVENEPGGSFRGTDRCPFEVVFRTPLRPNARCLTLLASAADLQIAQQLPLLYECVREWLSGPEQVGCREWP
jgi:hypothetical protein